MKKFLIRVIVILLVTGIISCSFCVAVDPYNVFHSLNIRQNGVEPNKNYIKMNYILNNPDKFDTFIFGSSRVGNIHSENILERKAYNMTYSEATPHEIYDNLYTLIDNGIVPKYIYVGVDSLSYTTDPENHNAQGLSAPYEMSKTEPLEFYRLYLDPAVVLESYIEVISKNSIDDEYKSYMFYEYGWNSDYGNEPSGYDFENADASIGSDYLMDECLNDIRDIVNLCNTQGIKYVIFTNPMLPVTYEASLKNNYYDFLRGLADITEFCNFSGYNDVTTDYSYWIDNSHYTAEASDMVKECIVFKAYYGGLYEQGFGQYVGKDEIEEFIDMLEENRRAYLNTIG